jgi:type I restriction enzyme S subunit
MSNSQKYPPDWTTQTLAEACDISIGGTPSRNQDSFWAQGEDGYPWVAISDMGPKLITKTNERITKAGVVNSNAKSVRAGTTLMSFKLTLGRMGIAGIDLYTNEAIAAFVPKSEDVNSKWLYHFLPGLVTSVTAEQAIKGQTLNKKKLNGLTIYLPSPNEQRRIAEILDTIDEAIQKTEALTSKLKSMKQGLLHDLLTCGLDKNGELRDPKAHPEQFKDSPLGRIPKEWKPVRLLDLVSIPNGQVDPKEKPYCHWTLIAPDHIESGTGRLLSLETAIEQGAISGKYAFKPGDVLYSKIRPYLRKAVLADRQGLCSADMYPLQPSPSLESRFLLGVILGEHFSRFATSVSERSGFPKINRKELGEYWLALPTMDEQLHIASVIETHDVRIRTEEQYRDKLKLQKKGLMHDLLTGKVRVRT